MKTLFYALLFVFITGCSSNVVMVGRQVSQVDPDVQISQDARIQVRASASGDPLTNKRYLDQLIEAFRSKGIQQVGSHLDAADFIAQYNLSSQTQIREQQRPIYEHHRFSQGSVCHRGTDGRRYCDRDYHIMPYLVGYETTQTSVLEAVLDLELLTPAGEVVLRSHSSVEHPSCSRWKLYEFLIARTIAQLDFTEPLDRPYRIEMPEAYQCSDEA
ncbi:hypothetical protein MAQ5080_03343 [Marinomonas aquimarina]|uniref:Lipoprotein n=1 Tax=Marinomonas aquimarina TaxID=295068 RepID=A0A1A8TSQ1_9GAMM|nr:hypothetical protein [Marinomonas aquimarina]SBS36051.1 hypothetical protein MAQ5080_03343 [Marinomonas aquimarina]